MDTLTDIEKEISELERTTGKQSRSLAVKESVTVDVTADECKKLCAKIGLKYFEGAERRVIQYKFTDATTDRYGDRITAKGVQLDKYRSNPIVLAFHNSWWFPIGSTIKCWYDKATDSVKGWVMFYDENIDDSGFATTVYKFASTGAVKTGSIGFIPVAGKVRKPTEEEKTAFGMTDWGYIYDEIELLEYSIVPLPANPSSMSEPITKGFTRKNLEKTLKKMEELEVFPAKQMKELMDLYEKTVKENKGAVEMDDDETPAPVPGSVLGKKKNVLTVNIGTIPDKAQLESMLKSFEDHHAKGVEVTLNVGVPAPIPSLEIVKSEPFDVDKLADLIHAKAGAVLSKKNKTLVKDTVSILSKSLECLQELLKAAGADAEDETDGGSDEADENDDGTKKPKKEKATQKGSPSGDPKAVTPNPYGPAFMKEMDKGIESLKTLV